MSSGTKLFVPAEAALGASRPSRRGLASFAGLLGTLLVVAACGQQFDSGAGGSGQGGAAAHAGTGGVSSTGGTGGTAQSGGSGGAQPGGGSGGSGGAPLPCSHELCTVGLPLVPGCGGHGCTADICQAQPLCCAWWWTSECTDMVAGACGGDSCLQAPNSGFCDHLVAQHTSLKLCPSDALGCTIQDQMAGETCEAFCSRFGVGCLGASIAGADCTAETPSNCTTLNGGAKMLCQCDLSCGGMPPCPGTGLCTAGNCP